MHVGFEKLLENKYVSRFYVGIAMFYWEKWNRYVAKLHVWISEANSYHIISYKEV
jgi:hypothetical protein